MIFHLTITLEEDDLTGFDTAPMDKDEYAIVAGFPMKGETGLYWTRTRIISHTLTTPLESLAEHWLNCMKEKHLIKTWQIEEASHE